jgi:hypothetical protein
LSYIIELLPERLLVATGVRVEHTGDIRLVKPQAIIAI